MSILSEPTVRNDGCLIRQTFGSRRMAQDAGGIFVGCTVGRYGGGIRPTAVSSSVTYRYTNTLLINANKMTIRAHFRTGILGATCRLICKTPNALNDNQFFLQFDNGNSLNFAIANAPGDFAQSIRPNANLLPNTEYLWHCVYDGSLAAGSRAVLYNLGAAVAATISGVIPVSMRASASPITLFNFYGAAASAPPTDFVLYDFAIWNKAFTAAEAAADAADTTYLLGGP